MTEQGAVPDNGIAVERREAQRPTSLAARTPSAAILGNGDIAVGAMKRTLARSVGEPRKLPGAVASRVYPICAPNMPISATAEIERAPSPRWGKRKKGYGLPGARRNLPPGVAERWLNAGRDGPRQRC